MYAFVFEGQGHQGMFSLVKCAPWLWGNCKVLLEHFKGTKAMTRGSSEQLPLLHLWRVRPDFKIFQRRCLFQNENGLALSKIKSMPGVDSWRYLVLHFRSLQYQWEKAATIPKDSVISNLPYNPIRYRLAAAMSAYSNLQTGQCRVIIITDF